ncbi:jg5325 [Pararge aegeria aegeria]|uniref:Jg5325 protein n=1 Tax=Pararge aegeria aegeria TaxID=348720 RepID=A0A8S4R9K2_9NEOP|nr:jg5325 [Pararge aegeria aegeria]
MESIADSSKRLDRRSFPTERLPIITGQIQCYQNASVFIYLLPNSPFPLTSEVYLYLPITDSVELLGVNISSNLNFDPNQGKNSWQETWHPHIIRSTGTSRLNRFSPCTELRFDWSTAHIYEMALLSISLKPWIQWITVLEDSLVT